jgi:heme/copper-type cytochrome/quinol oxidase subunit 2
LWYDGTVAFITVPLLVTTVIAVRFIRRRNRERALLSGGAPIEELDPSVVGATIVLTSLPASVMEKTLECLPPEMARSIVLVLPELPPIAKTTVEREKQRWLSHFSPPRTSLDDIEWEEPGRLAAATIRLVLEDSP